MQELTVRIHPEEGVFWAEIEELPGCFASGETMPDLVEAIQEAVSLYLSTPAGVQVQAEATSLQLRVTA